MILNSRKCSIGYQKNMKGFFTFLVLLIVSTQVACSKNRTIENQGAIPSADEAENIEVPLDEAGDCEFFLAQTDFDSGTLMIDSPGTYCLSEDISFNPNSAAYLRVKLKNESITAYDSSYPLRTQLGMAPGQYDPSAFGLGFFAAIAVSASDVVIDLQGKKISQSKEHALLQRFFSVIETSDRPFISGQGPFDFGAIVGAAENLTIKNGTIGRSSHHGIHGNRTKNLIVSDVIFEDFEVAAIAMNGVDGLTLKNLEATSRKDVPVLGQFSTAQFIKPYVDYLVLSGSTIMLNGMSAFQIQQNLKTSINNVHQDLIVEERPQINEKAHLTEWRLFHNPAGVVDGNAYGFLVNGVGVAVNGFPSASSTDSPSKNINIDGVKIHSLVNNVREVVSVATDALEGKPTTDPVGSIFQILARGPLGSPLALSEFSDQGHYEGNAVTDAQALVAKAAQADEFPAFLDTSRSSISPALIQWVESQDPLRNYTNAFPGPHGTGYVCNGDQMFHVNKGVIGIKLDGAEDVSLVNSEVNGVENIGALGSELCGDYVKSHPQATLEGYGGAVARGISVAGSKNVNMMNIRMKGLTSLNGSAIGLDILTDSQALTLLNIQFTETAASQNRESLPMETQTAVGMRIGKDTSNITADNFCSGALTARDNFVSIVSDESGVAQITRICGP